MALGYPEKQRYPNSRHLALPGHLIPCVNFAGLCFYQMLTEGPGIICFPDPDALQDQEIPAAGYNCYITFSDKILAKFRVFLSPHTQT